MGERIVGRPFYDPIGRCARRPGATGEHFVGHATAERVNLGQTASG